MDFTPSQDRQMLAETFGRHLDQRYTITVRRQICDSPQGWSPEHWRALADLGIIGALFDESVGGFGGRGFDIATVFEQVGRALVVEPFLGTLLGGRALALVGSQPDLLQAAIAGDSVLAFACEEPHSRYDWSIANTRARPVGDSWALSGHKAVVPQLEAATHVIVSALIDGRGLGLFIVERSGRGVGVRGYPLIDGGRGGELSLADAPAALLATDAGNLLEAVAAAGAVALAWEAVGVMDVLRKSTLDYLRTRKQFGIPIGKFQALQHRMVNLAIEIEQARSAAINAAAALDGPREERERTAAAAKFTVNRVGALAAEECIQLHGGIGMSRELPLSHYAKRAVLIGHQLGDEDHHLQRFMDLTRQPIQAV
jgi:alkylation response protein AidB-like acyl-CoA dehydrogenase